MPEAMQRLVNAPWPGNVRQLRNLIESMVVLAPGAEIRAADIPADPEDLFRYVYTERTPLLEEQWENLRDEPARSDAGPLDGKGGTP